MGFQYLLVGSLVAIAFGLNYTVDTMPEDVPIYLRIAYIGVSGMAIAAALFGILLVILPHHCRRSGGRDRRYRKPGVVASVNSKADIVFKIALATLVGLAITLQWL